MSMTEEEFNVGLFFSVRKSTAQAEKKGSGHDLLDGRRRHARNRSGPGASPLPRQPFRADWISPAYCFTSRLRFIS